MNRVLASVHYAKERRPNLNRKIYNNNYLSKDVKCLMAKNQKDLKSIKTTGIRKANLFLQVICV
jgi:hypothetical protein